MARPISTPSSPSGAESLEEALLEAKQTDEARRAAGFDQLALDNPVRQGFSNG